MIAVHRPAIHITSDDIAALLFPLDERVVAGLADRLRVLQIEEPCLVALMRGLVIDHGGAGMVTVARDQQAAAALAGIEVANQCLLSDAVGAAPAGVTIEPAIPLGFGRSTSHGSYLMPGGRWTGGRLGIDDPLATSSYV